MRVEPLTEALWPAFEDLLADSGGAAARCWCMAWRLGPEYRKRAPAANRDDFRAVVAAGPPPGLLALDDDGRAVGWCQVTPRSAIPALDRPWRLRAVDDVPVWAITCFYVRKGQRRQGITSALVSAAVALARAAGAPAVEAYPLDGAVSPRGCLTDIGGCGRRPGAGPARRRRRSMRCHRATTTTQLVGVWASIRAAEAPSDTP
ncbi:GNAT family N-acetyltransferase [Jiangella muralis]|uniref:GNAT family N-acetyltransferase n=1 Tax=Jiangella muralis TaxID=702383 RepID=UPI00069DB157|nr:GNAT family N-acetyltransferase [Jiangella muralis]